VRTLIATGESALTFSCPWITGSLAGDSDHFYGQEVGNFIKIKFQGTVTDFFTGWRPVI
jgi:hypothetical protein